MGLLICVAAAALVVGWTSGGSLRRLALVPLRGWPLVLVAFAAVAIAAAFTQLGGHIGGVARIAGPIIAAGCLLVLLMRNHSVEGVPLLAIGLLLNAVVIAANGAMPVSLYAESRAGVSGDAFFHTDSATHEVADGHTQLRLLGDVVPVPLPVHPETVSAGDVLIVSGVGLLIVAGMHRTRGRET